MFRTYKGRLALISVVAVGAAVALSGCSTGSPLSSGSSGTSSGDTLVVGSQDYYSNEIVAEIYAQALEAKGFTVQRDFRIGQREVYLPEIEQGKIDVFPEYTGDLLQALDPKAVSGSTDEVYAALQKAIPSNLRALDQAGASDGNTWTVTKAFADSYNLTDIASLTNVTEPIQVGGNSELATRPYGTTALEEKYGVKIAGFIPVEDGGGPLTVKALEDNQIQLTNIYTASPAWASGKLVALTDPDHLFFPSNVVPIVSKKVDDTAATVLNDISAKLSEKELVSLNDQSVNEQKSAAVLATAWLKHNGLG
ncbi:ABC transporter substrate-binding protein [Glaciibacter psychrotolerans]|uniref:Osmoprotectant transport system substrate-binding protein n=1 Tax=Glaciibacter psychrotolerans TaxID=670054 RepID=A0A7Z0EC29_9MICO|nr:ABC transporter substrate-binding protein [Leifsonia psychrotolerans]NYJ18840.1 osmoprotectant transport system substrate-binding protein [Leifsonia psychrotolerans]